MFRCKDPLADLLKSYGYNLVALPKPDIEPLQVLVKEGRSLQLIGHLRDLFKRGDTEAMPRKSKDIPIVKELQNQKSIGVQANLGLNLLSNFLKPMGAVLEQDKTGKGEVNEQDEFGEAFDMDEDQSQDNKPDSGKKHGTLDILFENVDKFIFAYENVLMNDINLIKLDSFIHDATVNEKAHNFANQLRNSELYVVSSTLKSKSFSTEIIAKNNASLDFNLSSVKDIIGGSVGIKYDNSTSNKLVYEGEDDLIFGFKAVRLIYDKKNDAFNIKSAKGIVMRGEEDYPVENLETIETFVDFS